MSDIASTGTALEIDYDSPQSISSLLEREGFGMRKRYGQNFLISPGSRKKILEAVEMVPGALVWEIGPGIGAMTGGALAQGARVCAFEIDEGFRSLLGRVFGNEPRFRLFPGDFLKTWPEALSSEGIPDRVMGNLPYNVAAAMVAAIIEGGVLPERMVFTVQREAAKRMIAQADTEDYSSFSVLCGSVYRSKIVFDLGAANFWPQPRVMSSVVVMQRREDRAPESGSVAFSRFTRSLFAKRRKTLRNNLKASGYPDDIIGSACEKTGIAQHDRAETLGVDRILSLYRAVGEPPPACGTVPESLL